MEFGIDIEFISDRIDFNGIWGDFALAAVYINAGLYALGE